MTWYLVPGFISIEVNEQGEIRSSKTHRIRKTWAKGRTPGQQKRQKIDIKDPGKPNIKMYVSRVVLSAKLGRPLESWEDACHCNGDPSDNRMSNLIAGCRLNNVIDELEMGRIETSEAELDRAIERLVRIKNKARDMRA